MDMVVQRSNGPCRLRDDNDDILQLEVNGKAVSKRLQPDACMHRQINNTTPLQPTGRASGKSGQKDQVALHYYYQPAR